MAWQNPKTNWKAGDVPVASDFNRIEGNIQELENTKETPAGAQAKANTALANAKAYTDAHEQKAAPHSGHETPAGAQAKANAAETNAKNHANSLVGALSNLLTIAKNNVVAAINEIFGKVEDVEGDLESHQAEKATETKLGHVKAKTRDGVLIFPIRIPNDEEYIAMIEERDINRELGEVAFGGNVESIIADSEYVYAGGSINRVRKYNKWTLLQVAESENLGSTTYALALDDNFVYAGGHSTTFVRKLNKSNLSIAAQSPTYGGTIMAIVVDDDYVYAAGETTRRVRKYNKSDLTFVAESSTYTGSIRGLLIEGDHIYIAGLSGSNTARIRKLNKSDLSLAAESSTYYAGNIYAMAMDDEFIYVGGQTSVSGGSYVRVFRKSDLVYVADLTNPPTSGIVNTIAADGKYIYVAGDSRAIAKYDKVTRAIIGETSQYGTTGSVKKLALDTNFVFFGGNGSALQSLKKLGGATIKYLYKEV